MKMDEMKKRLSKERPMGSVTLRMPEDVIEDLKRVAPLLGFGGYQPLMRAYIGQGLRVDLERLSDSPIARLLESLRRQGVSDEAITRAMGELSAASH